MAKTEWHREVTVRIDSATTITLSDEFGGYGSFIEDKLSKATDIFQAHELLIAMLQDSLNYHRKRASSGNQSPKDYSAVLKNKARSLGIYVEGEVA